MAWRCRGVKSCLHSWLGFSLPCAGREGRQQSEARRLLVVGNPRGRAAGVSLCKAVTVLRKNPHPPSPRKGGTAPDRKRRGVKGEERLPSAEAGPAAGGLARVPAARAAATLSLCELLLPLFPAPVHRRKGASRPSPRAAFLQHAQQPKPRPERGPDPHRAQEESYTHLSWCCSPSQCEEGARHVSFGSRHRPSSTG